MAKTVIGVRSTVPKTEFRTLCKTLYCSLVHAEFGVLKRIAHREFRIRQHALLAQQYSRTVLVYSYHVTCYMGIPQVLYLIYENTMI
jgi:hypothetical protein